MAENEIMKIYFTNPEQRIKINKNKTQLISNKGNLIVYRQPKKEYDTELGFEVNRKACKLIINTENVTFIKIMEDI